MAKIKITKEELQHDEVLESADVAIHWVREHLKFIVGMLVAVVAAYAFVGIWKTRQESSLGAANDILAEALDKYSKGLEAHGWATPERVASMKEVVALAQRVIDGHPGSSLARQALLMQGNAWYAAGDDIAASREGAPNTNEAINVFTRFVAEAQTPLEVAKGKVALAGAYENMFFLVGRPDNPTSFQEDARRTYKEVADDTRAPDFLRAEALLALGRMYAFQGQTKEAEQYYRQVMDLRYSPIKPPPDERAANRMLVFQLDQQASVFSLAGTARLELQRLGVDVEKEYPLVESSVAGPTSSQ